MLLPGEKAKIQIETSGGFEVEVNKRPYRKIGTALCILLLVEIASLFAILL